MDLKLLDRARIGLNLRVYASKPELVRKTVEQTMETVRRALGMYVGGKNVFSQVNMLVQMDERYIDCDCGSTAPELLSRVKCELRGDDRIHVNYVSHGDLYVGANNQGVWQHREAGMDYTMFLSSGLLDYFMADNLTLLLAALEKGALAAGIAMAPFEESVLAGRLLDTFDIWHIDSLVAVGGYDLLAAQPTRAEAARKENSPLFSLERDRASGGDEYVYASMPASKRWCLSFGSFGGMAPALRQSSRA